MIRRIDRYELLEQVGTGGMSVVYRGHDTALDREVAVKVLHPHLADRPDSRARFSREARAVARLSHPNIVEIFDYSGDGAPESWLVTEFVHGRTLKVFADEVGFARPELAALVCRALADALVHAHAAGVIHRDLKPENVMVCEERGARSVKLADFGIARILAQDDRMTMTGALMGSPNHMAPEIVEGHEADARSDVFSLGTILYWGCTGKLPFDAPNPTATLRRLMEGAYVDPREVAPAVAEPLARVIRGALSHDPERRPASAAALRDQLDRVLAGDGLERPGDELQAFLADPQGYAGALPPRLVAARLARGDALRARGDVAGALAAYDDVLAADPGNAEVDRRLRDLRRRSRWRRAGVVALVAAAVAGLVALALPALRGTDHAPTASTASAGGSPAADPAPAATPASPAGLATSDAAPPSTPPAPGGAALSSTAGAAPDPSGSTATPATDAAPRPPTARPAPDAAAGAATGAFPALPTNPPPPLASRPPPVPMTALVRPYAARALLDGVEVARGEQRVVFRIGPGTHRIRVEHPCCEPFERSVDASAPGFQAEIKVPLSPRPALLRVTGDPGTAIWLSGRLLGTAGDSQREPLRIPVPGDGENPYEGVLDLRLEPPGRPAVEVPVRARAGQEIVVPVLGAEGGSP